MADRRSAFVLATVLAGAFMALLDTTIVNVALPSVQHALHASDSMLSWTVSGYALAFGLVLIPAGRLGDSVGRKPLYLGGLCFFLLASLAAGISANPGQLVAARVAQGIGAGVFYTQINATIIDTFPAAGRRRAFGALASIIGLSIAAGPLAGGVLITIGGTHEGWRWVFLVNLVIGAFAVPAAARLLPAGSRRPHERADYVAVALLGAALLLILFPLINGQTNGWPLSSFVCLAAAAPLLGLLAWWELRVARAGRTPLIPPRLVSRPTFAAGSIFGLVYFAAFTSIFFTLSVVWQEGFAHGALSTGLVSSPFAIGAIITASRSHRVTARLGRRVLMVGCSAVATGFALLILVVHLTGPAPDIAYLVGPLLLAGLGHGLIVAPNIDFTLASVPPADNGTASGLLNTGQRLGSALGIAIVATVLFTDAHPAGPGPHALAVAFNHAFQAATLVNLGFVVLAVAIFQLGAHMQRNTR